MVFTPSARMIIWAQYKCANMHLSEKEVSQGIGIQHSTFKGWEEKYTPHFQIWLEESYDQFSDYNDKKVSLLEAVGMVEALQGNFQYWKEMSRTYGVIKDEAKNDIKLNFIGDFSRLLDKDLDNAQDRLLSELSSVAVPKGQRMVKSSTEGNSGGLGDRISQMQEECVVLPDSLDSDGGCSEQGSSIPALPEQAAPTSSD